MPVPCFTHEMSLDNALKVQSNDPAAKKIHEKYQQLSFSIDQKMIAARYFLGCLQEFDFLRLNEALSSSDQTRLIELEISYSIPVVYCDISLYAHAKPAYQFLINLLVDGVFANLVGITDILGKVIAEIYGFGSQKQAKYLHTVRDYMVTRYSTSSVSTYLLNNYPDNQTHPFHWLNTLKEIRNEVEHRDICEIGTIQAGYRLGGYGPNTPVIIYLDKRFFQSPTNDDERNVLNFATSAENDMAHFVDEIYGLLAQEVTINGVPI